ncbi:MAG: SH3 domain-containing protein, partial [Cyanobacteria bacterium J06638_22]
MNIQQSSNLALKKLLLSLPVYSGVLLLVGIITFSAGLFARIQYERKSAELISSDTVTRSEPVPYLVNPPTNAPIEFSAPRPPIGNSFETAFVSTGGPPLNVRNSPGGSVIGTLPNGATVELNGRTSGSWVEQTNGTWVFGDFLSFSMSSGSTQQEDSYSNSGNLQVPEDPFVRSDLPRASPQNIAYAYSGDADVNYVDFYD